MKITLKTSQILPTQTFLKPRTVQYILKCLNEGNVSDLPPAPLVRKIDNDYVAIDGHNLIAVMEYYEKDIEVYLVKSFEDRLIGDSAAVAERNKQLSSNFDTIPARLNETRLAGINSFTDLVTRNMELFNL